MPEIIVKRDDRKKRFFPPLLVVIIAGRKVGLKDGAEEVFVVDPGTHKYTLRLRRLGAHGSAALKDEIHLSPADRVLMRCGVELNKWKVTTQIWCDISAIDAEDIDRS